MVSYSFSQRALTLRLSPGLSNQTIERGILIYALPLFLLVTSSASAQPFEELITYRFVRHLPTEYRQAPPDGPEIFDYDLESYGVVLPVPVRIGGNPSNIIGGFVYNSHTFRGSRADTLVARTVFQQVRFRLGLSYQWNNSRHTTLMIGLPGFSTDGPVFDSDAFQMGGLVIHSYRLKENLTLKFGIYYNREFFGNFFMPLAGVDWRLPNNWYIYGLLPGTSNIHKQINDVIGISVSHRAPIGSCIAPNSVGDYIGWGEGAYAIFTGDLHITPFAFEMSDTRFDITFKISAGYTMGRSYMLFQEHNEIFRAGPFYEQGNGPVIRISASVRAWQ